MNRSTAGLPLALLSLRLSIFLVMAMWTADKFWRPEHGQAVFEKFYFLAGWSEQAIMLVGGLEALLLLAFVAGFARTWTYGLVLALHAVSTLSSYQQYLAPFEGANLLFFAAWPMLAACFSLYILREQDTLLSVSPSR